MLRNAVIEVKNVPVFYLPIMYYPIQKDDRATGILLPMYGSSLATGSTISNAFFWAINRSHDATFFHDWMFSRGNGARRRIPLHDGARRRRATSSITGSTRRKRSSTAARGSARQSKTDAWQSQPEPAVRPVGARPRRLRHRRQRCGRPTTTISTTRSNSTRSYTAASPDRGATCRPTARSIAPNRSGISPTPRERPRAGVHGGAERLSPRTVADLRHRQRGSRAVRS